LALALVLAAGAALMLRSFAARLATSFGAETRNVVTLRLSLPGKRYTRNSSRMFFDELRRRAAELPGVEAAAVTDSIPVRSGSVTILKIQGKQGTLYSGRHVVSPEYFGLFRIPLIQGRLFNDRDREGSPLVVLINKTAAQRFFPGENPLGQRMAYPSMMQFHADIIGVVADVKYGPPEEPVMPDVYTSSLQSWAGGFLAVRTAGDPQTTVSALREQVHALDPELPVYDVVTMEQRVALAAWRAQFSAMLLALMSALALLLAVLGTYGVFSYSVAARSRDIGVRVALGAGSRDVIAMVLREGAVLCTVALAVGLPSALGLTRLLSSQLYGVDPGDPLTFAIVVALLVAAAMVASYIPARHAAKIDPLEALRHE
jgi:putative ABC transport system permease protein